MAIDNGARHATFNDGLQYPMGEQQGPDHPNIDAGAHHATFNDGPQYPLGEQQGPGHPNVDAGARHATFNDGPQYSYPLGEQQGPGYPNTPFDPAATVQDPDYQRYYNDFATQASQVVPDTGTSNFASQGYPGTDYQAQQVPSAHMSHGAQAVGQATQPSQPAYDAGSSTLVAQEHTSVGYQAEQFPSAAMSLQQGLGTETQPQADHQAVQQREELPPGELQAMLDVELQSMLREVPQQRSNMANLGMGLPPSSSASTGGLGSLQAPNTQAPVISTDPKVPIYWDSGQLSSSHIARPLPSVPLNVSTLAASIPLSPRPRDRSGSAPTPGASSRSASTTMEHPHRHRRAASSSYKILNTINEDTPAGMGRGDHYPERTPSTEANVLAPADAQEYQVTDSDSAGPGFYSLSGGASPVSMVLRDVLCMLALPNANESALGTLRATDSARLNNLSLSAVLGPEYIRKSILDFRAFWLEVVVLEPDKFPSTLPKDDAVDAALVIILSLWINNYVASQILASRTPITRAEAQASFDMIMESVEVTVLLSIAAQVDLTKWSLEDVRRGWISGPVFDAARKRWYKDRVIPALKPQADKFYDGAMAGTYDHIFRGIYDPYTCPDMAGQRGNIPMLVSYATDYAMSGGNIHFITPNMKGHRHVQDVDKHELYTRQPAAAETLQTVERYHAAKKAKQTPERCWAMWRNKLMTKASSYLIFYFSRNAAVALRRFYDKRNPLVDPKETMDYASLISVSAAMISVAFNSLDRFGAEVTGLQLMGDPESQETFTIKAKCVRTFVIGTMVEGAPAANRADVLWFNDAMESRVENAISAAEGTRRALAIRAYYVTWDPSLPWMEPEGDDDEGPQQTDFLGWVQKLKQQTNAPPPPWTHALGKVYEEAIRAHDANVKRVTEASLSMEMIQMSHITPKSAGEAWPAFRSIMASARLTAQHDTTVAETIMSITARTSNPKRRLAESELELGAPTTAPTPQAQRRLSSHTATMATSTSTPGPSRSGKHRTILPAPNPSTGDHGR